MKKRAFPLIILMTIIFLVSVISAAENFTEVISNSEDWKDVYSTMHYANLKGINADFLVSTPHGTIILDEISKSSRIRVVSSTKSPYMFNYPGLIKSKGFESVDEISAANINIRLIDELPEINNFIIIDDSYGFSAIAVAPYAILTKSWVFFTNSINIAEIDSVLSRRNVGNVLIYGYTNPEIRTTLAKYNPKIINKEDRFQNNIEIVNEYLKISDGKQVILSNGEFIEKEIMKGTEPVLFTGKENVPDPIRDYLKNSNIEVGVLIGNDLIGAATNIRRTTGISVMVKFARGARGQKGGVAAVEGLDLFPIPAPSVSLSLHSIKYNRASSQLEVTYKSDSNLPIYFKGTITITGNNENTKVGDLDPIIISPGDFKTIIYPMNIPSNDGLEAEIYTLFGESTSSLDRILQGKVKVESVDVIDRCKFNEESLKSAKYNKQKKAFLIQIRNLEAIDCFVDMEIEKILIDNLEQTIGTEGYTKIPAGGTKTIIIKQELTPEDIEANPSVNLVVYSGEKEDSLVNVFKGNFPLSIELISTLTYVIIGVIILIIILIILFFILKRRKDDDD
jgi:hypothetical protein